jgi:hypothetical protein
MLDEKTDRPAYEPPTVDDLGTLEELTRSGANVSITEGIKS